MKTTLLGFTRLWRRRRRPGFGLPTGIALAVLVLAASLIGANLSDSSDKSEHREIQSPTNQFLTAYNSMLEADLMKEKGLLAEASDLYAEALNLFLKVSADYPQWQPTVLAFRINYCRTALQQLQESGERKATADPTTPKRSEGQVTGSNLKKTTDDGRQTTDDSPGRSASADPGGRQTTEDRANKQTPNPSADGPNIESRTKNQEPRTKNKSKETSDAANLSPLNSKLQQAALKERGRDYTGALAMYIALLEEYRQEPWALKGACRCCLRLGHMDQARALTKQALTLPLPDADLNLLAALVACHDGRYQSAILLLRQSLKQNGACPEAHAALGVALAATGNTKEAQEEMKRAISLNPKLGDAYYNLARLSLRQKSTDDKVRINYQLAIDTARVHYQNALRHGAAPDPELDKLLAE